MIISVECGAVECGANFQAVVSGNATTWLPTRLCSEQLATFMSICNVAGTQDHIHKVTKHSTTCITTHVYSININVEKRS